LTHQGRLQDAILEFSTGLKAYPNDSDVLLLLSKTNSKLAKREEQLGDGYFKTGDYENAVIAYTCSISANDTVAKVLSKRAKVYVQLQRLVEAESDTSRALILNHRCIDTRVVHGTVLMSLGYLRASIVEFDIILQSNPNNKHVLALRTEAKSRLARLSGLKGNILFIISDNRGAIAACSDSIAMDNSSGAVYCLRGLARVQMCEDENCRISREKQLEDDFFQAARMDEATREFRDLCGALEERYLSEDSEEYSPLDVPTRH
jgi:tetratricopeptide (TPR) repeat protein